MAAENEVSTSIEVGLPSYLPVSVRLQASFQRRWEKRGREFASTVAEAAQLSREQVFERAESDPDLGDLFFRSAQRAMTTTQADYRDDLARLVSRAFDDDALIEPASYLASILAELQPADLRVLKTLVRTPSEEPMKGFEPHTYPNGVQVRSTALAQGSRMEKALVPFALTRLEALDLVYTQRKKDRTMAQGRAYGDDTRLWSATPAGKRMLDLCAEIESTTKSSRH